MSYGDCVATGVIVGGCVTLFYESWQVDASPAAMVISLLAVTVGAWYLAGRGERELRRQTRRLRKDIERLEREGASDADTSDRRSG